MNEIEMISEGMAQELSEALERCNESIKDFHEKMGKLLEDTKKAAISCAIEKMMCYSEKYTSATFITRWYWLRKMNNLAKAIIEMEHRFL